MTFVVRSPPGGAPRRITSWHGGGVVALSPRSTERANGCFALSRWRGGRGPSHYSRGRNRGTLCISSKSAALSPARSATRHAASGTQSGAGRDRRTGHGPPGMRSASGLPPQDDRQLTNIVLMGMGEPLYNYESVAAALRSSWTRKASRSRGGRSHYRTSGVVPMIRRCGAELAVNLAVSLHAVRDDIRDRLVPLNRKIPDSGIARCLPELSGCEQCPSDHL